MSVSPGDGSTAPIVIVEDVWAEPFARLAADIPIIRVPGLSPAPDQLAAALLGAGTLVVRNRTVVTASLLDSAPSVRLIARAGVGLETIDVAAADARGVAVIAGIGANAVSVAELAVGLALALLRSIPQHDARVRDGGWQRSPGRELSGARWGLIGCGATGRATAQLLTGFGCEVLGYDPLVAADASPPGITRTTLADLLTRSQVISLHVPVTDSTVGLINAETLASMRPDAILINVARGEIVDETALAAALTSGVIAGAALDVRATEPPAPGPLDTAPNLILTPHIAGITGESQERIAEMLAADIRRAYAGQPLAHAVGTSSRVNW